MTTYEMRAIMRDVLCALSSMSSSKVALFKELWNRDYREAFRVEFLVYMEDYYYIDEDGLSHSQAWMSVDEYNKFFEPMFKDLLLAVRRALWEVNYRLATKK